MKDNDHATGAGWGTLAEIVQQYETLTETSNDLEPCDWARQQPLSVCVRSWWTEVGKPMDAYEFQLLMATGGPAVRIVGTLDDDMQPIANSIRLEVQDWGTPWTALNLMDNWKIDSDEDRIEQAQHRRDALEWFCFNFYYGD